KTTPLTGHEVRAITRWADGVVPILSYFDTPRDLQQYTSDRRTYNLTISRARPIKKMSALALRALDQLPSLAAQDFVRCALLNVGQLFLNGRRRRGTAAEFRAMLQSTIHEMLASVAELPYSSNDSSAILLNRSAADLASQSPFTKGVKANLVLTSPP